MLSAIQISFWSLVSSEDQYSRNADCDNDIGKTVLSQTPVLTDIGVSSGSPESRSMTVS
jgi:hypothetical protein